MKESANAEKLLGFIDVERESAAANAASACVVTALFRGQGAERAVRPCERSD